LEEDDGDEQVHEDLDHLAVLLARERPTKRKEKDHFTIFFPQIVTKD
jgi:hypothetical protein